MFKFNDDKGQLKCSFCGKAQDQVRKLVAGPGVFICDTCVALCNEVLSLDAGSSPKSGTPRWEATTRAPSARRASAHRGSWS